MITKVKERTKNFGNKRYTLVTTTNQITWDRIPTSHQLPCGCIGADIWSSDEVQEAECIDCGRAWRHMAASGPGTKGVYGSHNYCIMLDGQPQGSPVLILTAAMKEAA